MKVTGNKILISSGISVSVYGHGFSASDRPITKRYATSIREIICISDMEGVNLDEVGHME